MKVWYLSLFLIVLSLIFLLAPASILLQPLTNIAFAGNITAPTRALPPGVLCPNTSFNVTVNWTVNGNGTNSFYLIDYAPAGWSVSGNNSWSTPVSNDTNATGNKIEIMWTQNATNGTAFSAKYQVTVPGNATPGNYTFTNGTVSYYDNITPQTVNISGATTVTVKNAPVANFSANVTSGCAPLVVGFTDLSTNSPTAWAWTFGDGTNSTVKNPVKTYAAAGTYNVTLNASNACGSNVTTKVGYIVVNTSPVANFTSNVTSGCAPLSVQFNDTSTNNPTAWAWTFGDGTNSTAQNPVKTYNAAGVYNVTLNASNECGWNITTKTNYITVNATPVANFTSNVTSGCAPLSVQFNDTSTNNPTAWAWTFGCLLYTSDAADE